MAEMVTRSLEKDWVAKQRRESAKLLLAADLKVRLCRSALVPDPFLRTGFTTLPSWICRCMSASSTPRASGDAPRSSPADVAIVFSPNRCSVNSARWRRVSESCV